jgi:abequosyltransferase
MPIEYNNMQPFLLSITIPTFNRARFLESNLKQLQSELEGIEKGLVEILISDNCSEDDTQNVVRLAIEQGLPINYIRNKENLGWGPNFFQCFNAANGHYVLILSDDDLLFDGALKIILTHLSKKEWGVVCLKSYGFDKDFKEEHPGKGTKEQEFTSFNTFFAAAVPQITLLSASIFNKDFIKDLDTKTIEPGNFAHLHLILRCAAIAKKNLFIKDYLIASKRDNSSSYIYSNIFVNELLSLFDTYTNVGLTKETITKVENKLLFTYYPADVLRLRLNETGEHKIAKVDFSNRFKNNLLYKLWIAPILTLPRILAIIWGIFTTIIGKIYNGEYKTVVLFLLKKISYRLN